MKIDQFKKIDIKTRQLVNTLFLGNYKAAFSGRGIEFDDFREYTFSDDARYIDWVVSAREGRTLIRRYREERELELLFVVDNSVSMSFGEPAQKIQTLQETLYILGFSALQNGDKVGAYILGQDSNAYLPFKKGKANLFEILKKIDQKSKKQYSQKFSLNFLNTSKIKNILTFIFTDSLEVDESSLKLAKLKNDIVFIHISDSFENTLEGTGVNMLSDGNAEISINLGDTEKKLIYRKERKEKMTRFQKTLGKHGVDIVFIDNKKNPYKEILKLMKKREL